MEPDLTPREHVEQATDSLLQRVAKIRELIDEDDAEQPAGGDAQAAMSKLDRRDARDAVIAEHALGALEDFARLAGYGVLAICDAVAVR
jgi:hypothetical protein